MVKTLKGGKVNRMNKKEGAGRTNLKNTDASSEKKRSRMNGKKGAGRIKEKKITTK